MNGLFIVPTDLDSLEHKGVLEKVLARDEKGFLQKVVTVHPFALNERVVEIAPNHRVYEFRQPASAGWRIASWWRFLLHLARLVRLIRGIIEREEISFVRAQDPFFSGLVGYLASRRPRRPFCISIHADYGKMAELDPVAGAPRIFGSRRAAQWLERALLQRADRVLAITGYIGRYVEEHGADPNRIRLFRHRIDLRRYSSGAHKKCSQKGNKPTIAVISRLSPQKHVMDLIPIAAELRELQASFVIEVAGGGELWERFHVEVQAHGLGDYIKLLGFQSPQQVAELLRRCTVCLVLCGGASLVECAAAGSPVVAYEWEWHSELILEGKTGHLVEVGDIEGAAKALIHLLNNPDIRTSMGRRLRKRVHKMYNEKSLLEVRRSVYRELIGRGSCHPDAVYKALNPEEN